MVKRFHLMNRKSSIRLLKNTLLASVFFCLTNVILRVTINVDSKT